jgi:hypothetical protein
MVGCLSERHDGVCEPGEFREGLTVYKILSGNELEVIVSKLMAAEVEILHLAIEEENVSKAASDLWGVVEMLQEIRDRRPVLWGLLRSLVFSKMDSLAAAASA